MFVFTVLLNVNLLMLGSSKAGCVWISRQSDRILRCWRKAELNFWRYWGTCMYIFISPTQQNCTK